MRETGFRGFSRTTVVFAAALTLFTLVHPAGATPVQPQQLPPVQQALPQPQAGPAKAAPVSTPKPKGMVLYKQPRGMVLYNKPVFHNGHLVFWHGPWRGGVASVAPIKPREFFILADSADASAMAMAAKFASAMQSGGLNVTTIPGETSAAALGKAVSRDSADLAIVPMDGLVESAKGQTDKGVADWRERAPYLAQLSREPIALIAGRAVTDIRQLAGRKVNVEMPGGATAASAAIVFSRLNVAPTMTNEPLSDAVIDLARGKIDAIFVVGGENSKSLAEVGKDGRFHIVAIPYSPALEALYCPMWLTARDQPGLVGVDEKIDTIGVTTALVAIDAAPNSPRAGRLAPLANLLFEKFDQTLGASDNSNWKEVNLAARITGWPRFGATQSWLEQNTRVPTAALETFRNLAQSTAVASEGPSHADSDRLYESLMRWSAGAQ